MSEDSPDRSLLDARAKALARPIASLSSGPEAVELLHFRVASEELAIEASAVREIARLPDITPVPGLSSVFLGVANFAGEVLPVLDVRVLTGGLPSEGPLPWLVVLGVAGPEVGLAVSAVERIAPLQEALDEGLASSLVRGVLDGRRLVLIAGGILADARLHVSGGPEISGS